MYMALFTMGTGGHYVTLLSAIDITWPFVLQLP